VQDQKSSFQLTLDTINSVAAQNWLLGLLAYLIVLTWLALLVHAIWFIVN